ncbi:piggyBac transposable element-derived 4-like protein [Labeo rohita]|uniref:PiggyBac transposable element-derived 4-like protein n=1 Tax=Labeo rohita TaxID=84645 RepID=A0A498LK26_LABRO|nr:piggyBac transposable element-derived 4-like protein [Labeo rohita]
MARYTGEEALQMVLDSEEEFTFSSEEDCNSDDERLHFEERIDPAEDIPTSCYDEKQHQNGPVVTMYQFQELT